MIFNKRLLSLVVFLVALTYQLHAQVTMSVSPGFLSNSAHFGYKMKRVVPFVGFQLYSANHGL